MAEKNRRYSHNKAVDCTCTGFRPKFLTGLMKFSEKVNPEPHSAGASFLLQQQAQLAYRHSAYLGSASWPLVWGGMTCVAA